MLAMNTLASTMSIADAAAVPSAAESPWALAQMAFSSNAKAVGMAWVVSSAIFTTYSTTKFLKYDDDRNKDAKKLDQFLPLTSTSEHTSRRSSFSPSRPFLSLPTYVQRVLRLRPSSLSRPTERYPAPQAHASSKATVSAKFSPPALLTLYRFSGSLLIGMLVHSDGWTGVVQRFMDTVQVMRHFCLPAFFLFVANFCNSIALSRIGISLTYTSKCGIPLITVLLTILLDGPKALPPPLALLSLLPIAIGIAAASWSSPTFELTGFVTACLSATAQSALNVSSKRAMAQTQCSGPAAQRVMVTLALAITLAVTAAHQRDQRQLPSQKAIKSPSAASSSRQPPTWLACAAVVAYHVEYVLSFMFVKLVQPITYGTCDAVRRLGIILTGRAFFAGDNLTRTNILGIALALLGALSYSIASSQ